MWKYAVNLREWRKIDQEGKMPGKISNHTAVLLRGAIFLYGGLFANNTQNDHIYSFEIERNIWRLVRVGHSLILRHMEAFQKQEMITVQSVMEQVRFISLEGSQAISKIMSCGALV